MCEEGLDWQLRRNRFNHDWLKNQYMSALARFLNLLDDRIEDDEFERLFVHEVFPQWETHFPVAIALVHDFEDQMSPWRLFGGPALSRWPDQEEWLPDLVHRLWRTRYDVAEKLSRTRAAADAAQEAFVVLSQALESCPDGEFSLHLRALRSQFAEFRERCQDLAKSIESLPRSILVT